MPEYVINVKSKEVLSGFELALLECKVKDFFIRNENEVKVKAEYK